MTERLAADPAGVSVLAAQVAEETGIPAAHVEKDFWVTEVLRGVVASATKAQVVVVFKGGTSLSKAYRLIERFSEDVDVLVVLPDDATKGKRDGILKTLVDGAAAATGLVPVVVPGATTKGYKRGARFVYTAGHAGGFGLSEGVLLELGSVGGAMPCEHLSVTSLIASAAGDRIAGTVEAEPMPVRVLDPSRTLVEKLVLLHTVHSDVDPGPAVRAARHFYDVERLLGRPLVLERLADADVSVLARDVCTYSTVAGRPATPRPAAGFATSPAFSGGPHRHGLVTDDTDVPLPRVTQWNPSHVFSQVNELGGTRRHHAEWYSCIFQLPAMMGWRCPAAHARLRRAARPGRSPASRNSREAPPPVER